MCTVYHVHDTTRPKIVSNLKSLINRAHNTNPNPQSPICNLVPINVQVEARETLLRRLLRAAL